MSYCSYWILLLLALMCLVSRGKQIHSRFQLMPGRSLRYTDVVSLYFVESLEACTYLCGRNLSCAAFAHSEADGRCALTNHSPNLISLEGSHVGIKDRKDVIEVGSPQVTTAAFTTSESTVVTTVEGPVGTLCPGGYRHNPYSHTCVRHVAESKTWKDAKMTCESDGEYLLTFATIVSAAWLKEQEPEWTDANAWLGGQTDEDTFRWNWYGIKTGRVYFDFWASNPSQPNQDGNCMYHYKIGLFNWGDHPCTNLMYFFFEKLA